MATEPENPTNRFTEDLLPVLLHLRLSELMITIMQEGSEATATPDNNALMCMSREVFRKMDWYVGMVLKITKSEWLKKELNDVDARLADVVNIASFVAFSKQDVSPFVDFVTSSALRKQILFSLWSTAQKDVADVTPNKASFEKWYDRQFPASIISQQKPTNEHV